jgi:hypothetical protein
VRVCLYAILFENRRALCLPRAEEDTSIVRVIDALDVAARGGLLAHAMSNGTEPLTRIWSAPPRVDRIRLLI